MKMHGTTILAVRRDGQLAMAGDGQVTLGSAVVKGDAVKLRRLQGGEVLVGFAGATADAFALVERFEQCLKDFPANLPRAATEMAKQWRTDRALRRLEAFLIAANRECTLLLSGMGDVVQPSDGVVGIGSGGNYAASAARALLRYSDLSAKEIVQAALQIAAEVDIYTNQCILVEVLEGTA